MYQQAPALCFLLILMCHGETVEPKSSPHVGQKGRLHFSNVLPQQGPARPGLLDLALDKATEAKPAAVSSGVLDAKLKRMDPSVQCRDNAMTLRVTQARVPHFLVDSGEGTLIPVSKMASGCGFSLRRSRRDVLLDAPYQGCYVTRQGGDYVLPLRLWGAPMTMSCPAVSRPPSVSCFPARMVVRIGGVTENEVKVKVSDTWRFLSSMCNTCGLAIEVYSGGLSLTAPYHKGLCIETKDDVHSLSLLLTDVELSASCPSLAENRPTTAKTPSSDDPQLVSSPVVPSHALPRSQLHAAPHSWINTQHQGVPAMMSELSPHYWFPGYATLAPLKNPGAHPAFLQPHYGFPYVPQFHIAPWLYQSAPSPAPAVTTTTTEAMLTTEAPTRHDQKALPKQLWQPDGQIQTDSDPEKTHLELTAPHVYPRAYRIPVLYPPGKYFSRQQNKPFYYPPPYLPLYYPPLQKIHGFADPPANHPS
ncbi:uncharacterized protein LOC129186286 [Dunckerocampus dactyliophorus]|uniref:uncharacterized protein LOC129186286 n=1 Tax=Dunckerocampus dactyliophorus TaxID=161453 RepID=UPI002404EAC8|nr:uncharacterized protein LOC129186286 [Dunckerocampus dactyliophorus]